MRSFYEIYAKAAAIDVCRVGAHRKALEAFESGGFPARRFDGDQYDPRTLELCVAKGDGPFRVCKSIWVKEREWDALLPWQRAAIYRLIELRIDQEPRGLFQ